MKIRSAVLVALITAIAAGALAVRSLRLDMRPMHPDEANQAVKSGVLLETGAYQYDPGDHHGPSLYWLTLPSLWLSSTADLAHSDEFAYRIVPVAFGVGVIVLLLLVADGLGYASTVFAAILTAISPAMVFYSRYYVQEMLLVFFTFATIACAWRYVRRPSFAWAIAAGTFVGLMHATKETWVLAAAAMLVAWLLAAAWHVCFANPKPSTRALRDNDHSIASSSGRVASLLVVVRPYLDPWHILAALVGAVLVAVMLYSSFGANWGGPIDSITAYSTYVQRGAQQGDHSHPWYYYLEILGAYRPARGFFWSEGLILALAAVAMVDLLIPWQRIRRRATSGPSAAALSCSSSDAFLESEIDTAQSRAFCRFLVFYAVSLTVLYSAISYKTPWCMLSFLHAMILVAAVGGWAMLRALPTWALKVVAGAIMIAATVQLGWQCYWLNFRLPADQRNPYVYAHSSSDVLNLAAQMQRLARVSPEGHDLMIHVITPENYWPLPWYLRQFNRNHIGYWQDARRWSDETEKLPPPSVIIVTGDVEPDLQPRLRASYNQQINCGLRPGLLLRVYVRSDLWEAFIAAAGASE